MLSRTTFQTSTPIGSAQMFQLMQRNVYRLTCYICMIRSATMAQWDCFARVPAAITIAIASTAIATCTVNARKKLEIATSQRWKNKCTYKATQCKASPATRHRQHRMLQLQLKKYNSSRQTPPSLKTQARVVTRLSCKVILADRLDNNNNSDNRLLLFHLSNKCKKNFKQSTSRSRRFRVDSR